MDVKVEICLACGFVHRDDRHGVRQAKLHYHWEGTVSVRNPDGSGFLVAPTCCAACLADARIAASSTCENRREKVVADWIGARHTTDARYKGAGAFTNATFSRSRVPKHLLRAFDLLVDGLSSGIL